MGLRGICWLLDQSESRQETDGTFKWGHLKSIF